MEENDFVKFGSYLRKVRNGKNLTLEMVADDIKISIKYLKALEDSNIEIFPNEVLAVGFLRTYSEYLDIDSRLISTLFKDYKSRLNNSYIGIKPEDKISNSGFLGDNKVPDKKLFFFNLEPLSILKILLGIVGVILLLFVLFAFKEVEVYFKKFFKLSQDEKKISNIHEVSFDEKNFWNVSLKEGDFLSLTYDDNIAKYKAAFISDDLVIIDESKKSKNVFNLGEFKEIDLDDSIRVKIIYENYYYDKLKIAHVSLESFVLNVKYVFETNIDNRFNILNWQFDVRGTEKLPSSDYLTLYSSEKLSNVDLKINFLNDTFFRYADENNLYGKSLFVSKGIPINLTFEKSLILFFSRLSDVNIILNDKDITPFLKEQGKEIFAVQFFWVKTPSGFDLKVSEVY
ncbi:BB_0345 family helix-turn-helix protein [Borrelia sp. CA_690]|uniref:Helix-turn-helix domain-containing protein n=1 Tax=Borrelia maritima TaxID=2761123 RepID=A0A5J6WB86_9SPIR|nr:MULTISPECIES: BB_0345 family helix-turn-helix protein [Borrelia]QFI14473.1 helix-turn-helix domain-containing protein [Borrelia maritima]WKC84328.1 BB_0345 family helix-turn-helix protein [Borrelia sp. CA_690]